MRWLAVLLLTPACLLAKVQPQPDCTNPNAYPASMAFVHLKNEGLFGGDPAPKTTVERLASEQINSKLWKQVHLVQFTTSAGAKVTAIVQNYVDDQECSASDAEVFLVSKRMGSTRR